MHSRAQDTLGIFMVLGNSDISHNTRLQETPWLRKIA